MANTLKFYGVPFREEPIPDANTIWAFTFGILTKKGWDSAIVDNFTELLKKVNEKKTSEKELIVAMPTYANHVVEFNLYNGLKEERLGIAIYDDKIFLKKYHFLEYRGEK